MSSTGLMVALIGDRDPRVPAHEAIPPALQAAARLLGERVDAQWVPTSSIHSEEPLRDFDGLWCVPGSPYRSMDGALIAIRHARSAKRPFLGTCGGFQHAIVEYARNVLGWEDAEHAETAPQARRAVVTALECSLVEIAEPVRLQVGSRIARAYGAQEAFEAYRCRYGLNPGFREHLLGGPLRASAWDAAGEVRAVELDGHPFYVATLFQPERAALEGLPVPLAREFLLACRQVRDAARSA